jgi:modification methylase
MKTDHRIFNEPAQRMSAIKDQSIELVVTSPPYPMIEMWDEILSVQEPEFGAALKKNGKLAFELIHRELDKVWTEISRVLIPGGYACINIGDAARSLQNEFELFSNHSRIISAFLSLGFSNLPNIIWRKQTNAPNKFMGSGMLPAGAYVTLEHEWILIFRKGGKRGFSTESEKQRRRESAYFWEERNCWFSDLWDLKGTRQKINGHQSRQRSGSFPFELPFRLIHMYSIKGDTVLDPFLGMGTTSLAAMASQRNSLGFEIDGKLMEAVSTIMGEADIEQMNEMIIQRLNRHKLFIEQREKQEPERGLKHFNPHIGLPVVTLQETSMQLSKILEVVQISRGHFMVSYASISSPHPSPLPGLSSGSILAEPFQDPLL